MRSVIIGTGHIARQHLSCLSQMRGAEIAGVCDLSRVLAESVADRFGVKQWFTDHQKMLSQTRPDIVHITTPPHSHFSLAKNALEAGAHVIVEKPITVTYEEYEALSAQARSAGRALIENYNYVFNAQTQKILGLVTSGEFGQVTHVEVQMDLNILAEGNPFVDPNAPHPTLTMAGGAIADFLPHLASLVYFFVGAHRALRTVWNKRDAGSPLPSDEFRALVNAEHGTASLSFSANTQPDGFWLRVDGTKMRATANLFETRLTVERLRGGPKPLMPFFNAMQEAGDLRRSAFKGVWRKLSGGPGAYEGLWTLLRGVYAALETGKEPPVTPEHVGAINRMVRDLKKEDAKF